MATTTTVIKPKQIFEILDGALAIRKAGGDYIPCFAGDSGIGKSKTQQMWAKAQGEDFKFIDVRLAYMEGPDLVGLPSPVRVMVDGKEIITTVYALPEFLPKTGRGLIVFEEPNRAHESTMNACMQIFTDRKIGGYVLPDGFILSLAINPEGHYNVNSMDPALKNRVAMFDVKFDPLSFGEYMHEAKFNPTLVAFINDSNLWSYKSIDEIKDGGTYISPRTIEHANNLLNNVPQSSPVWYEMLGGLFGTAVASDFVKFANEIKPVLWEDIEKNKDGALAALKKIRDRKDYQGDLLSVTVGSVSKAFADGKVSNELLFEVMDSIDKDQAVNLLTASLDHLGSDDLDAFMKKYDAQLSDLEKRVHSTTVEQAKKRKKSKA